MFFGSCFSEKASLIPYLLLAQYPSQIHEVPYLKIEKIILLFLIFQFHFSPTQGKDGE